MNFRSIQKCPTKWAFLQKFWIYNNIYMIKKPWQNIFLGRRSEIKQATTQTFFWSWKNKNVSAGISFWSMLPIRKTLDEVLVFVVDEIHFLKDYLLSLSYSCLSHQLWTCRREFNINDLEFAPYLEFSKGQKCQKCHWCWLFVDFQYHFSSKNKLDFFHQHLNRKFTIYKAKFNTKLSGLKIVF